MVGVLFFFTVLMLVMSYLSFDPMKSSFFLVFSLVCLAPIISLMSGVWYAYYISLLFLSGVFVLLVYFSSISKFSFLEIPYWWLVGLMGFLVYLGFFMWLVLEDLLICMGYIFWFFLLIFFVLILFLNFVSYYVYTSGGLRKN
nr:NADH dehydrogenase subunit 6 [Pingus sinensis]